MKLDQRMNAVMKARLPMSIKGVLWVLARRANDNTGECWSSMKRLADDAGCSVSVAQRAVAHLEKLGLLAATRHPRRVTHFLVDLRAVRLTVLDSQIERLNQPFNLARNKSRSRPHSTTCRSCGGITWSTKSPPVCRACAKLERQATPANVIQAFPEARRK